LAAAWEHLPSGTVPAIPLRLASGRVSQSAALSKQLEWAPTWHFLMACTPDIHVGPARPGEDYAADVAATGALTRDRRPNQSQGIWVLLAAEVVSQVVGKNSENLHQLSL
jgi:hypothetical protein